MSLNIFLAIISKFGYDNLIAGVAQQVEQGSCKAQVGGSIPSASSRIKFKMS